MHRLITFSRHLLLVLAMLQPWAATASSLAAPEAVARYANREFVVLRTTIQGATPEMRVRRIAERLARLTNEQRAMPLVRSEIVVDHQPGILFSLADQPVFALYQGDLDEESRIGLAAAADQVELRFKAAVTAALDQGRAPVLIKGMLWSVLATGLMLATLWSIQRLTSRLLSRLQSKVQSARVANSLRWAEHAWLLVHRLAQLAMGFLWISVAYLWATFVLDRFPVTQPFAETLTGFLWNLLGMLGHGAISAIPGLLTVAIILFLTKAANDVVANVFENVDQGRSSLPGIHRDTARATRRLVGVLIWGFGLAVAYPYLPLADSDAFRGLSVMFGFMLTLGSAGIVTQMMSGLVLIYSRALKVGDFVSIGDVMGVVKETGVLSTKIVNMRNEEVTIPNAVLVGNPIKNYSSVAGEKGALVSTRLTIGYDTPWRQVHAMLVAAAEKTAGLRTTPKPFVMQKALQDFYVEYELFAHVDRPLERIQILSDLHAHIQDEFNAHGVQIMSPHFVLQPRNNVVVAREDWFAAPAEKP